MPFLYQEAEKFVRGIYWSETHDKNSNLNIPKLIEERLIKDNQEKDILYYGQRLGVVHATQLSGCLRGASYAILGTPPQHEPEARTLGVFKAGNLFEEFIIETLGTKVIHKQREYKYKYKNITLVGRSDFIIDDNGVMRIGETKSVPSDSFWYREREGTLVAYQNQIQLQVYMWLERILNGNNWDGIFSYVSKDDCTVAGAPIRFNQRIIDEVVIPALDIINEAYTSKNPEVAPLPPVVVYSESKEQYQKNWLAMYCEKNGYHSLCAGAGWILEATNLVTQRNKELKKAMPAPIKKEKPKIEVVK